MKSSESEKVSKPRVKRKDNTLPVPVPSKEAQMALIEQHRAMLLAAGCDITLLKKAVTRLGEALDAMKPLLGKEGIIGEVPDWLARVNAAKLIAQMIGANAPALLQHNKVNEAPSQLIQPVVINLPSWLEPVEVIEVKKDANGG